MTEITYENAGVNLAVSNNIKNTIKGLAQRTHSEKVLKGIGLFSGFYSLDLHG